MATSRMAWLTDIHLDFPSLTARNRFLRVLGGVDADGFLVGGDIGEADSVLGYLQEMDALLHRPIYFVLGNHDFYGGSIASVSAGAERLAQASKRIRYLHTAGVCPLGSQTALIGHGCWGDARLGNVATTPVQLHDFTRIEELRGMSRSERVGVLNRLGDEAADCIERALLQAVASYPRVIFLSHVPPFRAAAVYRGRTDDDWLPYFCCHAVGERIYGIMSERPDRHLTVLCGHTHGSGRCMVLPNLEVRTGGAQYGLPRMQEIIECV